MRMTGEQVEIGAVDGSLSGGDLGYPSTAVQGDSERVRKWLLQYVNDCKNKAEDVSANHLWESIDAENNAYGLRDKTLSPQDAGVKAAACDQEYEVKTKDLSDQVDEMTALMSDMIVGSEIRRLVPRSSIPE